MTGIGHNQPPAHEAFDLHITDLFQTVSATVAGATVENDKQETALDGLLDDLRKAKKDADAERAAEKKPHDDQAKAVQAKWKPLLDRCDMAANEIKRLLTPYRDAKQRAKDAEAKRLREEAEGVQKAAQDALRQSDDLEAKFAAEAQLKTAQKLTAAANRSDRAPTGLRTSWEAEVTDRRAALNFYIKRSPERFDALIQQLADEDARTTRGVVPGVLFHERKKAA